MKQYTKLLLVLLLFIVSFLFVACSKEEEKPDDKPDQKTPVLKIEKTNYELLEGESERIQTTIENSNDALEIVYESDNESVAKVENGRIMALSKGNANISAYLKDYSDNKLTLTVKVNAKPQVLIEGEAEVYTKHTLQLSYRIVSDFEITGSAVWESSDNTIATVDQNGLVTGNVAGTTVITVKYGDYKGSFTVKVVKEPNQYVLNFNGGASEELYAANDAVATINVTSNQGYSQYWAGGYTSDIYMSTRSIDPTATFSDRIYIGKNSETGYYEVLSIIQSGSSKWADGAEYVLSISNSYKSFATIHKQTELVSVGDVVFFGDLKTASQSKPVAVNFYSKKISSDKIIYQQGEVVSLPTPTKLGNRFLGWVDAEGNSVTSTPKSIVGLTNIYASWYEIDPVTALNVEDFATEIETGDKLKITASVSPSNAYFKTVLFSTSNKDIVNVDASGNITAVNAGKATIC